LSESSLAIGWSASWCEAIGRNWRRIGSRSAFSQSMRAITYGDSRMLIVARLSASSTA
jgi:hypothetical protein